MRVEYFGHTDIGTKRENNEDRFLCSDLRREVPSLKSLLYLFLVADGVGGQQGGETASALAAETVTKFILKELRSKKRVKVDHGLLLEKAFLAANREISRAASKNKRLQGMGTTLVAALVGTDKAAIANIGDSRAYLVKKKSIEQVSRDHTWAAEQGRIMALTKREIDHSPFKHMITRSLGIEADVNVDSFAVGLQDGEYVFLCTDGLHGRISDKEMFKVFRKQREPEAICLKLIQAAKKSGSRDNITAVVARVLKPGKGGEPNELILDSKK